MSHIIDIRYLQRGGEGGAASGGQRATSRAHTQQQAQHHFALIGTVAASGPKGLGQICRAPSPLWLSAAVLV